MDDIIKLCDELESCKRKNICYKNEIICIHKKLFQTFILNCTYKSY